MVSCVKHGSYQAQILFQLENKKVMSLCPICEEEKKQTREKDAERLLIQQKQQKIAELIAHSSIPKRFTTRRFENYRILKESQKAAFTIVRSYADCFEKCFKKGGGLILAGKPGTGKTHLAVAIANQVIENGHSVLFVSAMQALRSVKESYQHGNEQMIINRFLSFDLLIIDEVGVQFGTETEKLIFFEILNGRYEAMLPTIIVSNLTESELSFYLGVRILDRLQEGGGAFVRFDWDSYRKQVHLDALLSEGVS